MLQNGKDGDFFRMTVPVRQGCPLISSIIKRNAKAFALNAIVDVRRRLRRRHQVIFFSISKTIRVSDFKLYNKVALDSIYISTGNDVIHYFQ